MHSYMLMTSWLQCRTYVQFLSRVALRRNMTAHEARKVAKGRIWTGEDALHHGLVDKLGGLSDAVHIAKQEAGLPLVSCTYSATASALLTQAAYQSLQSSHPCQLVQHQVQALC